MHARLIRWDRTESQATATRTSVGPQGEVMLTLAPDTYAGFTEVKVYLTEEDLAEVARIRKEAGFG